MEIVQSLLTKMGIFRKPQMKALTTLFATILIACGKVNFTNLSCYSQRTERSYRRQFNKQFDFALFNGEVIKAATPLHHPMIAVMDCSFIAKSGKKTFGLDLFYRLIYSTAVTLTSRVTPSYSRQISTNRQMRFIVSTSCAFKSNLSSVMLSSLLD
ncbi:hypothetical protein [Nostoc sp.]